MRLNAVSIISPAKYPNFFSLYLLRLMKYISIHTGNIAPTEDMKASTAVIPKVSANAVFIAGMNPRNAVKIDSSISVNEIRRFILLYTLLSGSSCHDDLTISFTAFMTL